MTVVRVPTEHMHKEEAASPVRWVKVVGTAHHLPSVQGEFLLNQLLRDRVVLGLVMNSSRASSLFF